MINDRGTKKWTAMMLPEHVAQLRTMWFDEGKDRQPFIDELVLSEISMRINAAIEQNQSLEFTYWNIDKAEKITGHVHYVNQTDECYHVVKSDGDFQKIYFDEIMDAEVVD